MAEEISEAFNFTYEVLTAAPALQPLIGRYVFQTVAPRDIFKEPLPHGMYILGHFAAGGDFTGNAGARLSTSALFPWRVIRKGALTPQQRQADAAMDAVLQNIRAQQLNGFQFSVVRERPYYATSYDEALQLYTETGGYYRYYIS
jgi:hypothetical protein